MEPSEEKDGFSGASVWTMILPWDIYMEIKADRKCQIEGMTRHKVCESSQQKTMFSHTFISIFKGKNIEIKERNDGSLRISNTLGWGKRGK